MNKRNKFMMSRYGFIQRFANTDPQYPGPGSDPHYLNINRSTDNDLSADMKQYYSDFLIDNAEPKLVHAQFGQKHRIPRGNSQTIKFRKYNPYPKAMTPLSEGVTPNGRKLSMTEISATCRQYGDYTTVTDILLTTGIDNNLTAATKLHGSQAGRTLDTVTREVLAGGTYVQHGDDSVSARHLLVGGESSGNNYLTVDCIKRAVRFLKNQNAEPFSDGKYAAIIHPDCVYDIMKDPDWKYPHEYVDTKNIYEGEIGMLYGVRFVETTEAKIFHAADLCAATRTLKVSSSTVTSGVVSVTNASGSALTSADATALVGRYVIIGTSKFYVSAATTSSITIKVSSDPGAAAGAPTVTTSTIVYPGEAGAEGRDVYATIIMGENAYGDVELDGNSLEHIVKQLGSAGTADPLNQRATTGWKASKTAVRLTEAFMIRIETASTFEAGAN